MSLDIVGVREIAAMLGKTRQRVDQLVREPGFPRPDVVLAGGIRIWRRRRIVEWMARTGRDIKEDPRT